MRHPLSAQGATEYLILLSVVLIIALVSIALLGFLPGTATDSQLAESQIYWKSASPIAVVETGQAYDYPEFGSRNDSATYLRIRNTGSYPIRLVKMIAGTGPSGEVACSELVSVTDWNSGATINLTSIYLAPGEETCFGGGPILPSDANCSEHTMIFRQATSCSLGGGWIFWVPGSKACNQDGSGTLEVPNFGFEYTESIEGQTLTKRQIGAKPLTTKCIGIGNTP